MNIAKVRELLALLRSKVYLDENVLESPQLEEPKWVDSLIRNLTETKSLIDKILSALKPSKR